MTRIVTTWHHLTSIVLSGGGGNRMSRPTQLNVASQNAAEVPYAQLGIATNEASEYARR